MIPGWLKRWDTQIILLLLSPLILVGVMLLTEVLLASEVTLPYVAVLWTAIALGAVVISGYMAIRASSAWRFARRNYPSTDSRSLLAMGNFIVAGGLCVVHLIFLAVGITTLTMADESLARKIFGRLALVEGQYILLVIGVISFRVHQRVRQRVSRVVKAERLEEKLDEAAEVATERHIQYTEEHHQMLRETRDAALKAAALAEAIHKRE